MAARAGVVVTCLLMLASCGGGGGGHSCANLNGTYSGTSHDMAGGSSTLVFMLTQTGCTFTGTLQTIDTGIHIDMIENGTVDGTLVQAEVVDQDAPGCNIPIVAQAASDGSSFSGVFAEDACGGSVTSFDATRQLS